MARAGQVPRDVRKEPALRAKRLPRGAYQYHRERRTSAPESPARQPASPTTIGEAAIGASRTNTFLGERYRRIARRRGKQRAIIAVGRSILMIVWALLSNEDAHYLDLGPDYYDSRTNPQRRIRHHVHELQALGYTVILNPAA